MNPDYTACCRLAKKILLVPSTPASQDVEQPGTNTAKPMTHYHPPLSSRFSKKSPSVPGRVYGTHKTLQRPSVHTPLALRFYSEDCILRPCIITLFVDTETSVCECSPKAWRYIQQ
ncbi:hypothetical protein CSUI_006805, partial [Cystoisospora suis]